MLNWQEITKRIFSLYGSKSQTEIGEEIGVSQDTISRWGTGKAKPNWEYIRKIAEAKGKSEEWLLLGEENEYTKKSPTMKAGEQMISLKLYAILEEAHKALSVLSEKVSAGTIDPVDAHQAVAAALKIVWQAHDKPGQEGKRRHSKTDTRDTGKTAKD